ncbi:MAG TPA: ATP-binding protein [Anaerolineae bacterium]|nr:ATP-binding protein [Anaerolineae bacterium]
MHDHAQLEAAVEALTSPDWPTRLDALTAIRRAVEAACPDDAGQMLRPRLLSLLGDPSWKVRQALATALTALPQAPELTEALEKLSKDSNRYVREAASRALSKPRAASSKWRRTVDKEDPVFQMIWTEIRRVSPSSLSETALYEAAQRVAESAYRTVAADATHQLNTVLLAIDGFAEHLGLSLSSAARENPEVAALFERLKERTALARRIVANLRYYSALPDTQFQEVDATALLREAAELARVSVISRKLPLPAIRFGEMHPAWIQAAKDSMLCALTNVICNALEACTAEGVVTLDIEAASSSVAFVVQDNGCGMDESQLAIATKRFTTNKSDIGGTGMGLAIAQRVIEEQHRGRLEISSAVGQGTTVRIVLPLGEGTEGELTA